MFDGSEALVFAYSDSDYAGDLRKAKSTCSYLFVTNGGIVAWKSKLQLTIVAWTTDAENMAMDDVEFVWCKYIKLKYYLI